MFLTVSCCSALVHYHSHLNIARELKDSVGEACALCNLGKCARSYLLLIRKLTAQFPVCLFTCANAKKMPLNFLNICRLYVIQRKVK
jgi:hypothetical protein